MDHRFYFLTQFSLIFFSHHNVMFVAKNLFFSDRFENKDFSETSIERKINVSNPFAAHRRVSLLM